MGIFGIGPQTAPDSLLTSFVQSESSDLQSLILTPSCQYVYVLSSYKWNDQNDAIIYCSLLEVVDSWTDSVISVGKDHKYVHTIIRPPTPVHGYAKKHK